MPTSDVQQLYVPGGFQSTYRIGTYMCRKNLELKMKSKELVDNMVSISDPDPVGSGFKLPSGILIRIRNPDPESEIEL